MPEPTASTDPENRPAVDEQLPRQQGKTWVDDDYVTLIERLAADEDILTIAQALGRTTNSIRTRFRWLVPPDLDLPRSRYEQWLRDTLRDDIDYDWRAALSTHHAQENRPYFGPNAERLLREAWTSRRALPEVAAELGFNELAGAQHIIALKLAVTLTEVADRLGASPGGDLDGRVRRGAERLAVTITVLIVDGLPDGRHISVHDDSEAAEARLDTLLQHVPDREGLTQVHWTIADRSIAGDDTGPTHNGKRLPLP